jgi:hypothetical protein
MVSRFAGAGNAVPLQEHCLMPVRVNCPLCQAGYTLPDQALGTQIQCTQCGKPFAVGSPAPVKQPAPARSVPAKARPGGGRLRSTTEPRPPPARAGGGDFEFGQQPGTAAGRTPAPHSPWGRVCLFGCLILACLFVLVLAGASITGWWLVARHGPQPGPTDSLLNPWTGSAREATGSK